MQYRLTPANEEDRSWLDELRRAVYRELFDATWGGWDEARHQRHFAACWELGKIDVVELDGARVGMIQLFECADALEVGEVQVQPSNQGQGIGTRLLRDVMARAYEQRKKVSLSTGLQNLRAVKLYERLGFKPVARSETHIHMQFDVQL